MATFKQDAYSSGKGGYWRGIGDLVGKFLPLEEYEEANACRLIELAEAGER